MRNNKIQQYTVEVNSANQTMIITAIKFLEELDNHLMQELNTINNWLNSNKLSLDLGKTGLSYLFLNKRFTLYARYCAFVQKYL